MGAALAAPSDGWACVNSCRPPCTRSLPNASFVTCPYGDAPAQRCGGLPARRAAAGLVHSPAGRMNAIGTFPPSMVGIIRPPVGLGSRFALVTGAF